LGRAELRDEEHNCESRDGKTSEPGH
jgi:hypothetical protein